MFWPGIVGKGSDDELSWKREVSQLDPDLPIDTLLTKGIVFAGGALDRAGADVYGRGDFFDGSFVISPLEEIDQRNFDAVLVIDLIYQFGGCGRGWNGGVVVEELAIDGKIFAVVEKEGVSVVAFQLCAEKIWTHSQ